MNDSTVENKLLILVRVEPGCLGPTGVDYIEGYCQFAEPAFAQLKKQYLNWRLVPRFDKSLPEIEYHLRGNRLTDEQVTKYLDLCLIDQDDLETELSEKLGLSIDKYLERL